MDRTRILHRLQTFPEIIVRPGLQKTIYCEFLIK